MSEILWGGSGSLGAVIQPLIRSLRHEPVSSETCPGEKDGLLQLQPIVGQYFESHIELRYVVSHATKRLIMPTSTAMLHVMFDERVKAQATETLAAMGLSVSDPVRVF